MCQCLRAFVVPVKDLGSAVRTHMATYNYLEPHFQGTGYLLLICVGNRHVSSTYTYGQAKHS